MQPSKTSHSKNYPAKISLEQSKLTFGSEKKQALKIK